MKKTIITILFQNPIFLSILKKFLCKFSIFNLCIGTYHFQYNYSMIFYFVNNLF